MDHANGQSNQRDYTYDALGNRTAATNQVRFTAADAFSIQPRRALTGDTVNILGRNFPFAAPGTVAVTVAGQAATLQSVAPNVITFTMPSVAGGGQVAVTIGGGTPIIVGDILFEGIAVTPTDVEVTYSEQVQFSAQVTGGATQNVTWRVNDIAGGNATVGTISSTGLYTAPSSSSTVEFPIIVSATSSRIDLSAYALVKSECSGSTLLVDDAFANGAFAGASERVCYTFNGVQGEYAYIAYLGGPTARSLKLRDSDGALIASASNAATLKLGDILLPRTDTYRLEVESGPSGTAGAYQIWFDRHAILPKGQWLFPLSGNWQDATNWSRSQLPLENDAVTIPDKPGAITVTVSSGTHKVASVNSLEGLRLQAGTLEVVGDIKVSAPFEMTAGALKSARIVRGTGGQTLQIVGGGGYLDTVRLATDIDMTAQNVFVHLRGGLVLQSGNLTVSGANSYVYFEGTQTIDGSGKVLLTGTNNAIRSRNTNTTLTIGRDVAVAGRGTLWADFSTSSTFLNRGVISANVASGTLAIRGAGWTNEGRIESTSPTSILRLEGTILPGGLGKLDGRVGLVDLAGTLLNTGRTVALNANTGSLRLNGGTISGGTLDQQGGAALSVQSSSSNRLVGVQVLGDLNLTAANAAL
ncbi:MAG: IPT/TIG domain-containing protein, partial [Planctomycetes bacterium]|nr:IPT/TIG domain-containing protein [Planctomycetota bacterium]